LVTLNVIVSLPSDVSISFTSKYFWSKSVKGGAWLQTRQKMSREKPFHDKSSSYSPFEPRRDERFLVLTPDEGGHAVILDK
jgi:hypothetical protein